MRSEDLRKNDKSELEKSVIELKKKLSGIRFNFSANKIKNTKEIQNIKREIARILTILRENRK